MSTTSTFGSVAVERIIEHLRDGTMSSEKIVKDCLNRIEQTDPYLSAWQHVDVEGAIRQAVEADERRQHHKALGALHGIPVGIKDIIDTLDLPTERGSDIFKGRLPSANVDASKPNTKRG